MERHCIFGSRETERLHVFGLWETKRSRIFGLQLLQNSPLQHMFLWRNPFDGHSIVILLFWFNYIWFGLIYLRSLNTEIWDCRYSSWFVNYVLMSLSLMSPFKTRFYYFLCCCWRLKIQSLSYIQIHFSLRCRPLRNPTLKVNFMSISYTRKKQQDSIRQWNKSSNLMLSIFWK